MSRIEFNNRAGLKLVGNLELPAGGDCRATALFAHCFTCTRDIKPARIITQALADSGLAVLRFDFTGLGESEGDFADTHFSSNLDDLEDAALWMGKHLAPPQLLVGHSLGGAAALAVAERLDDVRAVATLGAPSSPDHVLRHFEDSREEIERTGSAEVLLAGRPFRIRRDFIEDARSHDLDERLRKLRRAVLVLHSPHDDVVSIDNAERIFKAALHPKSFVSLNDADHLLSVNADAEYAAQVIAAWAMRFLAPADEKPSDRVRVAGRTEHRFLCGVQAGRHAFVADEPQAQGGADRGPDPYALLAAALGTCTVMTLNLYARHKKLDVDKVVCEVAHRKVHVEDCEDCEKHDARVDELNRRISIEGNLDEAQRRRMLEIADRCPVHRTLNGRIRVHTVGDDAAE